jgi:ribosomal protein S18 acetylase RimI-like enzyme
MIVFSVQDDRLEIRPVTRDGLEAVLEVYRQCEDFLALGPVAAASMEMVLKDLEISENEGGIFCGIHTADGQMIGVVDYVPRNYQGNSQVAYLSLLMIALPFRNAGIGKAVVDAVEKEIRKDTRVVTILAGVQVNNPQAVRFWQRNGYRIASEPKQYPDQTTAVDLRKDMPQWIDLRCTPRPAELRELLDQLEYPPEQRAARTEQIAREYEDYPAQPLFGWEHGGQLVGVIGLRACQADAAEIRHIVVRREYRRHGMGRQLIDQVCRQCGLAEITAETDQDAVDFYRKAGFQITRLGEKYSGRERFLCRLRIARGNPG